MGARNAEDRIASPDIIGVVAVTAFQGVGRSRSSVQCIVAVAAEKRVGAFAPAQAVIVVPTIQAVVAGAAIERVIAVTAV